MKRPVNRFRAVHGLTSSNVEQVSHHIPGYEDHPDLEVEKTVLAALAPEVAERAAKELNDAFNLGREYATQR
jgi:hypothetical protein